MPQETAKRKLEKKTPEPKVEKPEDAESPLKKKIEEIKKRIEEKVDEKVPKPGVVVVPQYDLVESVSGAPAITSERVREVESYHILKPHASVRILYDEKSHEHTYSIIEPVLSEDEKKMLAFVEETLVDTIAIQIENIKQEKADKYIREKFEEITVDYGLSIEPGAKEKMLYYLARDFLGYGKIDVLMRDPMIEDISCDGPKIPIFLYHRKYESMKSSAVYENEDELDSFVIKLAQLSGKHISIAEPILDATMPEGSRLQLTLSKEVTSKGSTFTIRKFRETPFTPPDLATFHTMSSEMIAFLWLAIQSGASIMFAGGTASGKTTTLNAMSLFIPPQMKIVSIEDTRELNLPHPNWIPGITRSGFGPVSEKGTQSGEIDMFTLLREALRQRPEYIIVGEVRGKEAYVMFQAMATGHSAYGTMHADSVESVIHRLESDPINVPRTMLEALDIVCVQIQTRIGGKRVRRCKQVVEIVGIDPHTREILTNEVFKWVPGKDEFVYSGLSYTLQKIMTEKGIDEQAMREELDRRREIIEWMQLKKMKYYKDVAQIVSSYYNDPEKAMARIRDESERIKRGEIPEPSAAPLIADEKPAKFESLADAGPKKPAPQKKTAAQSGIKPAEGGMKRIRCPRCKKEISASYGRVTCPSCGFSAIFEKSKSAPARRNQSKKE